MVMIILRRGNELQNDYDIGNDSYPNFKKSIDIQILF